MDSVTRNRRNVRAALKRLGPQRVKRAMRAFSKWNAPYNWNTCFLACAYGRDGALNKVLNTARRGAHDENVAARALGLTKRQVDDVCGAFDDPRTDGFYTIGRRGLKAEAKAYLQANA